METLTIRRQRETIFKALLGTCYTIPPRKNQYLRDCEDMSKILISWNQNTRAAHQEPHQFWPCSTCTKLHGLTKSQNNTLHRYMFRTNWVEQQKDTNLFLNQEPNHSTSVQAHTATSRTRLGPAECSKSTIRKYFTWSKSHGPIQNQTNLNSPMKS